jgi:hypothetical protein
VNADTTIHQHPMTLYNLDIIADWNVAIDDHIRIVDVRLLRPPITIFRFISGKVLRHICDDIENAELKRKWV